VAEAFGELAIFEIGTYVAGGYSRGGATA